MFYIVRKIGDIIGVCTKCASTVMVNGFYNDGMGLLSNVAVIELRKSGWKVTGVVRDPIDRSESAFNFFQHGQTGLFPKVGDTTYSNAVNPFNSMWLGDYWNGGSHQSNTFYTQDVIASKATPTTLDAGGRPFISPSTKAGDFS